MFFIFLLFFYYSPLLCPLPPPYSPLGLIHNFNSDFFSSRTFSLYSPFLLALFLLTLLYSIFSLFLQLFSHHSLFILTFFVSISLSPYSVLLLQHLFSLLPFSLLSFSTHSLFTLLFSSLYSSLIFSLLSISLHTLSLLTLSARHSTFPLHSFYSCLFDSFNSLIFSGALFFTLRFRLTLHFFHFPLFLTHLTLPFFLLFLSL
ncbi:unnamed protein product [Acanthosepion pharaonis]|uniref:Uncharacterized protein n=1 Tax=Acanthosepion pharaonis TaxID=158019 RepID=A0A812BZ03_ACAPH|nr:unnamed protein product [Sepia pharaonis]